MPRRPAVRADDLLVRFPPEMATVIYGVADRMHLPAPDLVRSVIGLAFEHDAVQAVRMLESIQGHLLGLAATEDVA